VPTPQSRPTRQIDIAEVIRDAHLGDLRWVFAENRQPYDFEGTIERLFALLDERGIDYVLVGGLAMLQYVEGRNTRDIDLVMAMSDVANLPELEITGRDRDFVRGVFDGVHLDILLTDNPLFAEFRRRFVAAGRFGKRDIPCATPEGLVFLKLFALPSLYRQGDAGKAAIYETDILMLLAEYEIDTEALLALLGTEMLATDVAMLREIVAEIRARIARSNPFGPSGGPASPPA
jgi:hypothetical protein